MDTQRALVDHTLLGLMGIEGDYYNVVGLPLTTLTEMLKQVGVDRIEMNDVDRYDPGKSP